ncbi:protein of unknown function [Lentzea albidocapillata subsp. violacea]|uniref:Uncharacterized protein n=1 Tax=Lentzea albidocapillata subsp. violacea TaxID=128104 RepID=A0A1G9GJB6_9PSEU|nr:DUF932 domain-containing protein [Lentzea albidocapillata]SDL00736.1 protein of unknown function [Lentzea albidocapillata subsp. violacea]
MTEPVTPAQNTPAPAKAAQVAAKAPASKAPAKAPAAKPAPAKAPATKAAAPKAAAPKAAAPKAAAPKAAAPKAAAPKAAAKAPAVKADSTKATTPAKDKPKEAKAPEKAGAKPVPVVPEPIKPGKDSWARISTRNNGSRSISDLLNKAGLSGWDVKPEGVVALAPTGLCIDCERAVGELHKKECPSLDEPDAEPRVSKDDTCIPVPMFGSFALMRKNPDSEFGFDVLGHTKSERVPVPIEVRAEMLTSIMKETKAKTGPAGPLWEGRGAFASIRLPEPIMVGGKDPVELRLVLVNSVVPGRPSQVMISPVRLASQTTFPFDLGQDCKHVYDLVAADDKDARISETSDALSLLHIYGERFAQVANELMGRKITDAEFSGLTNTLFPFPGDAAPKDKRERHGILYAGMKALTYGKLDVTADIDGTWWAALQAVMILAEHADPAKKLENGDLDYQGRALDVLFSSKHYVHDAFRLARKAIKPAK